jgi:hypothetical protein
MSQARKRKFPTSAATVSNKSPAGQITKTNAPSTAITANPKITLGKFAVLVTVPRTLTKVNRLTTRTTDVLTTTRTATSLATYAMNKDT